VEESIWVEEVREDASAKDLGPCHRSKGGVCTKKEEGLLIVKRGKRGDTSIYERSAEKGVHLTL